MGIKNQEGQVLVPAAFEALGWSDGSFSVIGDVTGYRLNNRWGILNLKKEFVTKAEYESLVYASGEFVVARKKINPALTKTGCLNLRGEIKIPFHYDGISIYGLRAIVFNLENGHYLYGLIDFQNTILIPLKFKSIYPLGTLRFAVENQAGKIGLFAEDGRPLTEFRIDSISQFYKSRAIIYQDLRQGLIDRDGNRILEPIYHSIRIIDEERTSVLLPHEWQLLNERNEIQLRISADELIPQQGGINIYQHSNQYGILNSAYEVILPAQYDRLVYLGDDYFQSQKNKKNGVIHADNSVSIPFIYDSLLIDKELIRAFRKAQGWSLIDRAHRIRTEKQYAWINQIQGDVYPVKNNGYWGLLNQAGKETINCVFDSLLEISNDQLVVKFRGLFGIINSHEEWLIAPQSFPLQLINDTCYLELQPKNKFLKKFNGEIIYFTDNQIDFKSDHWTEYLPDGTIKTLNYQGQIISRVSPPELDKLEEIFSESEGMRGIKRDGKFGFVDSRGRLRIANRYDGIGNFKEGLAPVKLLGKWGFLNMQDQIVINPNYDIVQEFSNGLSVVRKNGKSGVIDKTGKFVLTPQYDSIKIHSNNKLLLHLNSLIGLADKEGSILIEPRFDHLQELDNGFVIVGREGKFGVTTLSGLSAIPVVYDKLTFDAARNQYLALKKSGWKEITLK